jgi:hypothetical protein
VLVSICDAYQPRQNKTATIGIDNCPAEFALSDKGRSLCRPPAIVDDLIVPAFSESRRPDIFRTEGLILFGGLQFALSNRLSR